jgi:hypothetical protein
MGNPSFSAHVIGFLPEAPGNGVTTLALNTNDIWLAFSFIAPRTNQSLDTVTVYVSAVGGTLDADDLRCDIFSNTAAGIPDATLGNTATVDATPTGAAYVKFTFGTPVALTANTKYWVVLQNDAADAATNYPTYLWGLGMGRFLTESTANTWGWGKVHSINAGVAWATGAQGTAVGILLHYSTDSSSSGLVMSAQQSGTADLVYDTRMQGAVCTIDSNATFNVSGICAYVYKTGTPGDLTFKLYNNTTSLGTTVSVPVGNVTSGKWIYAPFATSVSVTGGTALLRIVAATTGGTTGNYYRIGWYSVQNVAGNLAQGPFGGTWKHTYYDGASWTDTAYYFPIAGLVLDSDGPFVAAGGGGGFPILGGSIVR